MGLNAVRAQGAGRGSVTMGGGQLAAETHYRKLENSIGVKILPF